MSEKLKESRDQVKKIVSYLKKKLIFNLFILKDCCGC